MAVSTRAAFWLTPTGHTLVGGATSGVGPIISCVTNWQGGVGSCAQAAEQPTCFLPIVWELQQAGHEVLACGRPQTDRPRTWVGWPCVTVRASPRCADGQPSPPTQRVSWLLACARPAFAMWMPPPTLLPGAPHQFPVCRWQWRPCSHNAGADRGLASRKHGCRVDTSSVSLRTVSTGIIYFQGIHIFILLPDIFQQVSYLKSYMRGNQKLYSKQFRILLDVCWNMKAHFTTPIHTEF